MTSMISTGTYEHNTEQTEIIMFEHYCRVSSVMHYGEYSFRDKKYAGRLKLII